MKVYPKFKELTEKHDLNYNKALFFAITYEMLGEHALSNMLDSSVLSDEEIDKYRILFFDKDYETGKHKIKEGLLNLEYTQVDESSINSLMVDLRHRLITKGFTSQGHPNNRNNGIMQWGKETEDALLLLSSSVGTIDLDILVAIIDKYYESAEMPQKLSNYLTRSAIMDYENELINRNRRRKEG